MPERDNIAPVFHQFTAILLLCTFWRGICRPIAVGADGKCVVVVRKFYCPCFVEGVIFVRNPRRRIIVGRKNPVTGGSKMALYSVFGLIKFLLFPFALVT